MYEPILTPQSVEMLLKENPTARLLDVRTPGEFDSAHIHGSYNVPLDELAEHRTELQKVTAPVILVCQSGNRARQAEQTLRQAGMENLHLLDGGIKRWQQEGRSVKTGKPRLTLERQVRILAGLMVFFGGLAALFVHPYWATIPTFVGAGLTFAGITDSCAMAMMLARLPYNRAVCDANEAVCALVRGR